MGRKSPRDRLEGHTAPPRHRPPADRSRHYDNIITYIERSLTNAVAEGLNRIVKIAKNRASGFRGLHNFADMIYLIVGDLDIPAPARRL